MGAFIAEHGKVIDTSDCRSVRYKDDLLWFDFEYSLK